MSSKLVFQNNVKSSFGCIPFFSTSLGKKERKSISKEKKMNIKNNIPRIKILSKKIQQQQQPQQLRSFQQTIFVSNFIQSNHQTRFKYKKNETYKNIQKSIPSQQFGVLRIYQNFSHQTLQQTQTPKFISLSESQVHQKLSKKNSFLRSTMGFTTTKKTIIESQIQNHEKNNHQYESKLSIDLQKSQFLQNNLQQSIHKQFTDILTDVCSPVGPDIKECFSKQIQKQIIKKNEFRQNKIQLDDIRQVLTQFDDSEYSCSIKDRNISQYSQVVSNDENILKKYNQFSFGFI